MKKNALLFLMAFCTTMTISGQALPATDATNLKLLFVGDVMGHLPQIQSAYNPTTKTHDYKPCFQYVKPIIEQADLAVGNLEVTLSNEGKYTGYPMFRSPDALAEALKDAGFDLLVTANNHSNDNRAYGVTHTIDVLQGLNFYQTGTFKNQAEKDLYYPLLVYKNGFRLAFLNYTYDTNGIPTAAPTIVNLIDEKAIQTDLAAAKNLQPDAIIVVMHWGLEYQLKESPVQQALAKKMFEWGADLVIGAHPHVIQPIKKIAYTDTEGIAREGLVVYSLGNFISNQSQPNTDGGLMVEIDLTKPKGTNRATVAGCSYIPVWRYIDKTTSKNPYGTYYALPVSIFEKASVASLPLPTSALTKLKAFAARTRQQLQQYGATERTLVLEDLNPSVEKGNSSHFSTQKPLARFAHFIESPADTGRFNKIIPLPEIEVYTPTPDKKVNVAPTKPTPAPPADNSTKSGDNLPPATAPKKELQVADITDNYLIQFQTSRNLYTNNLPFEQIVVREQNGWFKYFINAGNDLAQAQKIAAATQAKGFADAFVVKKEAVLKMTVQSNPPSGNGNQTKGDDDKIYKVQFQTSRNLYPQKNLPFSEYDVVESNGWFKYYTGNTASITEAQAILQAVQKAGYKDAFVVPFENGKPLN